MTLRLSIMTSFLPLIGRWIALAALLGAASYGLIAQTQAPPSFEAVSIKRNVDARPRGMLLRPQAGGR